MHHDGLTPALLRGHRRADRQRGERLSKPWVLLKDTTKGVGLFVGQLLQPHQSVGIKSAIRLDSPTIVGIHRNPRANISPRAIR